MQGWAHIFEVGQDQTKQANWDSWMVCFAGKGQPQAFPSFSTLDIDLMWVLQVFTGF